MARGARPLLPILLLVASAVPAGAAHQTRCSDPGGSWRRATPAQAGFDATRLQTAVDWASARASLAIKVFRFGCLVAEDRGAPSNDATPWESMSMAKSVVSMLFGRAVQLGYLHSANEKIGRYLDRTEYAELADRAHRSIKIHELLTQTHGLHWNLFRDYNIEMPDRVADALSLSFGSPTHAAGSSTTRAPSRCSRK